MQTILTLNFEQVPKEEAALFRVRNAARAVVFDDNNDVALLSISKEGVYKLPGGGVEEHESLYDALKRECREEIGVEIEIDAEIGLIVEIKGQDKMVQNSYCFTARMTGKKNSPHFTESENARGCAVEWVAIETAIQLVAHNSSSSLAGRYVSAREAAILEAAQKLHS